MSFLIDAGLEDSLTAWAQVPHLRKYFPDFYLPTLDVYLDPKNDYYLKRDLPKLKQVIDKYKIKLFYGQVDDIKKNIDGMMVV